MSNNETVEDVLSRQIAHLEEDYKSDIGQHFHGFRTRTGSELLRLKEIVTALELEGLLNRINSIFDWGREQIIEKD